MILQFTRGVETVTMHPSYISCSAHLRQVPTGSTYRCVREDQIKSSTNTAGASPLGGQGLAGTFQRKVSPTRSPALIRPSIARRIHTQKKRSRSSTSRTIHKKGTLNSPPPPLLLLRTLAVERIAIVSFFLICNGSAGTVYSHRLAAVQ